MKWKFDKVDYENVIYVILKNKNKKYKVKFDRNIRRKCILIYLNYSIFIY